MSPDRGPVSRCKCAKPRKQVFSKSSQKVSKSWFDWSSVSLLVGSYMAHNQRKIQRANGSSSSKAIFKAEDILSDLSSHTTYSNAENAYKKFVPMPLTLEKAYLIEEFYYIFKHNFAAQSVVHRHYCEKTSLEFKACFRGSPRDIQAVFEKFSNEFAAEFAQCFDSSFHKIVHARKLTKEVVESKFLPMLLELAEDLYFWNTKKRSLEETLEIGSAIFVMTTFDVFLGGKK